MPWSTKDVESHKKGLSEKGKKRWVAIANAALKKCIANGGDTKSCEGKAVRMANGAVAEMAEDNNMEEMLLSLNAFVYLVKDSFYAQYDTSPDGSRQGNYWCKEVFMEHPVLGNALVTEYERTGELFAVGYNLDAEGMVSFTDPASWKKVRLTYEMIEAEAETENAESELTENAVGNVLRIVEHDPGVSAASPDGVPLSLDVQIIKPGWGNKRDGHYYGAEMLKQYAPMFSGAKMYESDHRPDEKSTRTWVSTVKEVVGYTEEGAPIGRVVVHDPDFAKRLRALDQAQMLPMMECSILAKGTARNGKVEGQKAKIVESITEVHAVDWVTRAGAGGRALRLSESEGESMEDERNNKDKPVTEAEAVTLTEGTEAEGTEAEGTNQETQPNEQPNKKPNPVQPQETAPVQVGVERVRAILGETSLPQVSRDRLVERTYKNEAEVEAAIAAEIGYLKQVTQSGAVFGQGSGQPQDNKTTMTETEYNDAINAIFERHGLVIK